jgi:hypothetical protein
MPDVPLLTPVISSNLHAVGHDGEALYVQFKTKSKLPGSIYRYPTAGPEHREGLLTADSAGRYFAAEIKTRHNGELVPPT